ncbi:hypothetical protein Ddye_018464 [Dipteronia dyeriana]|uniref:Uncharacterized protein n=1 Tax=Dipteronia dyeriana TaxID=168575 RepID=A0AAD9UB65_9ROSI|nr:hypothetical protein Ddye_018464 [Dipteronia dyeriana]
MEQGSLTFMALQIAIYALLKMAIEVEVLLSHERYNNPSPVKTILTRKLNAVAEYIESQLSIRNSELVLVQRCGITALLATLGLFAYIGRMTRIFLSNKGIKDFDELVKDFLRNYTHLEVTEKFLSVPFQIDF